MTLRGGQSNGSIRTWRRYFPLTTVNGVVDLVREILTNSGFDAFSSTGEPPPSSEPPSSTTLPSNINASRDSCALSIEPDLTFISIVLGYVENHLTITGLDNPSAVGKTTRSRTPSYCPSPNYSYTSSASVASSISGKIPPSPLSVHTVEPGNLGPVVSNSSEIPSPLLSESRSSTPPPACVNTVRASERHRRLSSRRSANRNHHSISSSWNHSSGTEESNPINDLQNNNDSLPLRSTELLLPELPNSTKRRRFSDSTTISTFPCLTFEEVDKLYQNFYGLIINSSKLRPYIQNSVTSKSNGSDTVRYANRALIRTICEVLWTRMVSGKGREKLTHTQSVYSFLTAGILDSFGLAYTTVAACQLLGYSDVDLALSEDHGWVEFGPPDNRQSADVASLATHIQDPHYRSSMMVVVPDDGLSDDLVVYHSGLPPSIRLPPLTHSWLYVNGHPVVCRPRILAVVAAVASLQPGAYPVSSNPIQAPTSAPLLSDGGAQTISGSHHGLFPDLITPTGLARHLSNSPTISVQVVQLKSKLLWMFYHNGCLTRYPVGLTNLADLEDAFHQTWDDPSALVWSKGDEESTCVTHPAPLQLYHEAVDATRHFYSNQHVYPYTCLAGYLYRHDNYREALHYWSEAAKVIGQYNHSSEDWEVYRELLDVATQLMPHMFRMATDASRSCSEGSVKSDPDGCLYQPDNILDDPQCLAYLLAFYDHLCLWEEGSPVPVLHVGWVDKLMVNLMRFSARARRLLRLSADEDRLRKLDQCASPCLSVSSKRSEPISPSSNSTTPTQVLRSRRRSRTTSGMLAADETNCLAVVSSGPTQTFPDSSTTARQVPISWSQPLSVQTSITKVTKIIDHTASISPDIDISSPSSIDSSKHLVQQNRLSPTAPRIVGLEKSATTKPSPTNIVVRATLRGIFREAEQQVSKILDCHPDNNAADDDDDDQDASPSPPSLTDFPSPSTDMLNSLADACDHHLLNPAFLFGTEPSNPFLPANVSREDSFTRLLALLKPPKPCACDNDLSSTKLDACLEKSTTQQPPHQCDDQQYPVSDGGSGTMPPREESGDDMPHELIDSMVDMVTRPYPVAPTSPGHLFDFDGTAGGCPESDTTLVGPNDEGESKPVKTIQSMDDLIINLSLYSVKMISIVELLRATRLNASAIKLALTAQSQVSLRRTGLPSLYDV